MFCGCHRSMPNNSQNKKTHLFILLQFTMFWALPRMSRGCCEQSIQLRAIFAGICNILFASSPHPTRLWQQLRHLIVFWPDRRHRNSTLRQRQLFAAALLETSSLLTGAAPFLLGIGPARLPIRETSIAIIDSAMLMAHTFWNEVRVDMVTAMPGSWTSKIVVIAAPGLLVCRPSEVPIGVSSTAVVPDMLRAWHGSLFAKMLMIHRSRQYSHINPQLHRNPWGTSRFSTRNRPRNPNKDGQTMGHGPCRMHLPAKTHFLNWCTLTPMP